MVVVNAAPSGLVAARSPSRVRTAFLADAVGRIDVLKAGHLVAVVEVVNRVEDRVGIGDIDNGAVREDLVHHGNEGVPLVRAVKVVAHEEAIAQQKLAELGDLGIGELPVPDLDGVEPRVVENVVILIEVDRLLDGFGVNAGQAANGGGQVAVETLNRGQDTLDLNLVDAATGATKRILQERSEDGVHPYEPLFLQDGRHFLWASDRTGYNHLYRYTVAGKLENAVTRGEWSVAPWGDDNGATGLLGVDEKAGWAYYTAGSQERQLWKVRLDGTGAARISKERGTHVPRLSPDCRFYLDACSSAATAPSLTLRRADGTAVLALAQARPAPDLARPALFTLPAADGTAKLTGARYFFFFVWVMLGTALLFLVISPFYRRPTSAAAN